MHRGMVSLVLGLVCVVATGCPSESKPQAAASASADAKATAKGADPKSPAPATPKGPDRVSLKPMPVSIMLPPKAKLIEKREDNAMIEIEGVRMNVSTKPFADQKNTVKNFPFDTFGKWVRDEEQAATAEMGADAKNYRALREFEVDGKKYVCSNVGTTGMASAEAAEKMVARCESLKPEK